MSGLTPTKCDCGLVHNMLLCPGCNSMRTENTPLETQARQIATNEAAARERNVAALRLCSDEMVKSKDAKELRWLLTQIRLTLAGAGK